MWNDTGTSPSETKEAFKRWLEPGERVSGKRFLYPFLTLLSLDWVHCSMQLNRPIMHSTYCGCTPTWVKTILSTNQQTLQKYTRQMSLRKSCPKKCCSWRVSIAQILDLKHLTLSLCWTSWPISTLNIFLSMFPLHCASFAACLQLRHLLKGHSANLVLLCVILCFCMLFHVIFFKRNFK